MERRKFIFDGSKVLLSTLCAPNLTQAETQNIGVEVEQITFGSDHHFFGYIGQSLTIPWNKKGNRLICLSSPFHDHLPGKDEAANVNLIHLDYKQKQAYKVEKLDESQGWNHQQGTMFYWNPHQPDIQFFFNDRDPKTGVVYTVLYDIKKRQRVKTYHYPQQSFGNSGVCPVGKYFLAINYARMARLRPVTGYKDSFDWSADVPAPKDDGIAIIDIETGEKKMLLSFEQMAQGLERNGFDAKDRNLFINHTLWSRDGQWIYFFVRGGWKSDKDGREALNVACSIKVDGSQFVAGHQHIGGHPEWYQGTQIIGSSENRQVVYDIAQRKIVRTLGNAIVFPKPEGDISLSPDGKWLINGHNNKAGSNFYSIMHLETGSWVKTPSFNTGIYKKDLRIDPAPRWNHQNNQVLVSGLDENGIRQLFVLFIDTSYI
ncbi:hypothetical protein N9M92_04540 [Flavobacteriaceae bacterium]|nr:hypothetical protein [Flavobacteriaceae bacterium]MDA8763475.1 hypothetical protein [Flavobacteriaceae bacterium]